MFMSPIPLNTLYTKCVASCSRTKFKLTGQHCCDTYFYEHIIQAVLLLLPTGFEELSPLREELDPRSNYADSLLETDTSANTRFISLSNSGIANP
jgi:hypothetical protein